MRRAACSSEEQSLPIMEKTYAVQDLQGLVREGPQHHARVRVPRKEQVQRTSRASTITRFPPTKAAQISLHLACAFTAGCTELKLTTDPPRYAGVQNKLCADGPIIVLQTVHVQLVMLWTLLPHVTCCGQGSRSGQVGVGPTWVSSIAAACRRVWHYGPA